VSAASNAAVDSAPRLPGDVLFAPDPFDEVRAVALERECDGNDVLVVRCRSTDDENVDHPWQRARLERRGSDLWVDDSLGLELRMLESELAALLLSGGSRSSDESSLAPCECAPGWPQDVTDSLSPWPLKGRGTVLFDVNELASAAVGLRDGKQGPMVVPGGARKLGLASASISQSLDEQLSGMNLRQVLCPSTSDLPHDLSYGNLLELNPALAKTGGLDLSNATTLGDRHTVQIWERPFNCEVISRRWTKGALIRRVGKGGVAQQAGCKPGDVIVSSNGKDMLDAPWEDVAAMVTREELPLTLELAQPVLTDPMYLREAKGNILHTMAKLRPGDDINRLFPQIRDVFSNEFELEEAEPLVFAGDGGSASHVHTDSDPQIQMCHVLHGSKFFGVVLGEHEMEVPWIRRFDDATEVEVSLPADVRPPPEQASWLSSEGVSVAWGRSGDILLFWGGTPHFGCNGRDVGPCVAAFHACKPLFNFSEGIKTKEDIEDFEADLFRTKTPSGSNDDNFMDEEVLYVLDDEDEDVFEDEDYDDVIIVE